MPLRSRWTSLHRQQPMKPTISIALITLGLTFPAPAMAAPIHLTCTETESTWGTPSDRRVFINASAGTASVGGAQRDLLVEPNQYRLMTLKSEPMFLVSNFVIDRTTLKFTSSISTDDIKRESSGQCRITPAAAGAQF